MYGFEAPPGFHKTNGQPVQQFRVCRPGTCMAEIVQRPDKTISEVVFPDSIDHNAGR